jgi:hypothetical protein
VLKEYQYLRLYEVAEFGEQQVKQVKGKCMTSNFKENGQNVQIITSVVDLDEHD